MKNTNILNKENKFKFPNFLIFADPRSYNTQTIGKESNRLGIFSFGFVDTQSDVNCLPYWAISNTKNSTSLIFYYFIIKSIVLRSKMLKIKNFFL